MYQTFVDSANLENLLLLKISDLQYYGAYKYHALKGQLVCIVYVIEDI